MSIDFADAIVWLWFIFLGGSIGIGLLKAAYGPAKRQIQRVIPIQSWREQKEIEDAERRRVESLFLAFVGETRPLAPKAKRHQEAAVFRHAWKRAAVLEILFQRSEERVALYQEFQNLASAQYYPIAPSNAYGTVQLKLEPAAAQRLMEVERKRLLPPPPRGDKKQKPGPTKPCVYYGIAGDSKVYVGQTQEPPERRWLQHRTEGTGPFKGGHQHVIWDVVKADVPLAKLDETESYYIGLYDSLESGYNENRGNDIAAYERGSACRMDEESHKSR